MKFKLDENIPADLFAALQARGHDVETVAGEGLVGAPDPDVLDAATIEDRMLVTLDRGFGDVRAYPPASHPGILVLRPQSALEHDGTEHGVNGLAANPKDRRIYNDASYDREEQPTSKNIDDLLAAEAKTVEEAEAASDPNAPLPAHVRVARGHPRAKNLQVRFREDEYDELAEYAQQRGLPVSTVVRSLVLQAIAPADDLKAALDKLETDLAAVRRKALSA